MLQCHPVKSLFSNIKAYYRLMWYHEIAIYNIESLWDTVLTLFVHGIKRGIVHIHVFSLVQNRARHSYFDCSYQLSMWSELFR